MPEIEFNADEIREQAKGNQTAIWHLALRWVREQSGDVDSWASFVGSNFAPSWDELGDGASALEVARLAALNVATTADMRPLDVAGDETEAIVTVEGPERDWLERMGSSVEDLDRMNEIVFQAIAERRGLRFTQDREGDTFHMTFRKS